MCMMPVYVSTHAMTHMWRPEDNFVELILSFYFIWVPGTELTHKAYMIRAFAL